MTRQQIIERVKVSMEEVTPFDDGLAVLNSEVKPITSYIESSLQPACNKLLMICPLSLTSSKDFPKTSGYTTMTSVTDNGKQIGTISLPVDFIRLHSIKIEGWERTVNRAISEENPLYMEQLNQHTRGKNAKPVVVKKSGILEIYTFDSGSRATTAKYVPVVKVEETVALNDKLYEPLIAMVAAEVYMIFGEAKQAELFTAKAETLLKTEL